MALIRKLDKPDRIHFYLTEQYPCSYIKGYQARSKVASPPHLINYDSYNNLIEKGFRRSGVFSYKPYCDKCSSCIPIRIPVYNFFPNRTQKRTSKKLKKNLVVRSEELSFNEEHFLLYKKYQSTRHSGSGMDQDNRNEYMQFLLTSNVKTELVTFRDKSNILKMVCIFDILKNGMSSVYTFFSPDEKSSSYGTYGILWQIEECKKRNLSFLYLGYWINQSSKMVYKTRFRPYQMFDKGLWTTYK